MSIIEKYKTIKKEAEASQIIEKSKFIAYVKPVETKEEADEFIAIIKKKHRDATHNVPAMVIGDKFQIQWASDDGEPQGTSGAPIVQMLVKEQITNVAVVVTRYFGGVKLGTGGLVRAYTSSAKLGIAEAELCKVIDVEKINIVIDYQFLAKIQNIAGENLYIENSNAEFIINNIEYGEKVTIEIWSLPENMDKVTTLIKNITGGQMIEISKNIELERI